MSKLIKTTLFALIVAAALVGFRGPGPRQPKQPAPKNNQTPGNNQQRVRDTDTLGRIVDLDSARECIRLYAALANKSRLTPREEKLYPRFRRSRVNTTGEVFSSRKLLAWLQSIQDLYDSQKLTLHLDIELGLYTEQYLRTYHPTDEQLRKKLLGRVGIFIIPIDSVSKWSIDRYGKLSPDPEVQIYSKATVQHGPSANAINAGPKGNAEATWFGDGGGGQGYDIGGIKP